MGVRLLGSQTLSNVDLSQGGQAGAVFTGAAPDDRFAYVGTGDFNGDGRVDLVVGAIYNDAGGTDAGRSYVFFGRPSLLSVDLSSGGGRT